MKTREQVIAELASSVLALDGAIRILKETVVQTPGLDHDAYDVLAMACGEYIGAYAQCVSFARGGE